ncbi:hypothetical protein [Variovorax sp. DXTD-1]|uniref:hypothetical protein n=1 Tax=Variovorax sp. DXTD-1 TaxID=2495592 RepID=UPI000F873224|nr:hypothetical protein [Variovorax sp. DXTD-1]RST45549.1 hypothetical protein EJI00_23720 [Variovorax sp. DXTD-1]
MANRESSGVGAVFRNLMGAQSEAQAFGELRDQLLPEGGTVDILLAGALERLSLAVEGYEEALRAAGVDYDGRGTVTPARQFGGRSEAQGGGEAPLQSGARID